ncbi:KAP family NTPase [Paenibacillus vini]|uniref:KAP family P-loop NTPase fold protein n=1 Tax=Paenibacillus vini TaxID=1476024 RepID=UPI0025B7055D|nr:KAP family NTPase [Paenibacillus vini]MDN4066648.1 KAP family NTPase [Paenibacillus vini]
MINKIVEKTKIVAFIASVVLMVIIFAERVEGFKQLWNAFWLMDWLNSYWFSIPFILVVFVVLVDELRRRKFLVRYFSQPPFTFRIDTLVLALTIGLVLYYISSAISWSKGVYLNNPIRVLLTLGLICQIALIIRYLKVRNIKPVDETDGSIHVDRPITEFMEDKLERSSFATQIADTIVKRDDKESLVIGLYGKWGSGKTSVMNLIKKHLSKYEKTLIVNFNPWYFENEGHLISQFFEALTKQIDRSYRGEKGELVKKLNHYSTIISPLSIKVGIASISFKDALNIFKKKEKDIIELRKSIEELIEMFDQRIVIFIDDLDRLDKKEAHAVVKLVKLIADFPNTAYVLAFDDKVVAAALSEQYGVDELQVGESFLEKIIQVPLHLPPADQQVLRNITLNGLSDILSKNSISLSDSEISRFVSAWDRTIFKHKLNIRLIKRYLNAVTFSVPLLKDEVNIVDLFCIEGLRTFFPKVHLFIFEHSLVFLTAGRAMSRDESSIVQKYKILFDSLFDGLSNDEIEIIKILIEELFPRSKFLFTGNNHYGYDWDKSWNDDQRICGEDYFERYFVYTVPSKQVSDVAFNKFIEMTEEPDIEIDKISEALYNLAKDRGFASLIKKLRLIEDKLSVSSSINLAKSISKMGKHFSKNDGFLGHNSTHNQAAYLINKLIELQPKDIQLQISSEILDLSEPITFANEIFNRLRPYKDKKNNMFSEAETYVLARTLINRIKLETTEIDFLEKYKTNSFFMLWIWNRWGDKEDLHQTIKGWFDLPDGVELFLSIFLNPSFSMETGVPVRSEFDRDNYNNVNSVYPVDVLANKLLEKYSMPKSEEEYYRASERTILEQVAIQFLWIHSHVGTGVEPEDEDQVE